jgi:hypothetical protein
VPVGYKRIERSATRQMSCALVAIAGPPPNDRKRP